MERAPKLATPCRKRLCLFKEARAVCLENVRNELAADVNRS
jgi:hypothetical protein